MSVDIEALKCIECTHKDRNALRDHSLYSRGSFRTAGEDGLEPLTVDVEVESLNRALDPVTHTYRLAAALEIRCPNCGKNHRQLRQIADLPLQAIRELTSCPTCGQAASITVERSDITHIDEESDRLLIAGTLSCPSCHCTRSLTSRLLITMRGIVDLFHLHKGILTSTYGISVTEDALTVSTPVRLFYSYSHKDEELRNELEKHLILLRRNGIVDDWHDRRITPGTDWVGKISENIISAEIILLLISADFIASDYCYEVEMQQAIKQHRSGRTRVIPIILRPVDWSDAPFAELQALPKDGRPVVQWPIVDEAMTDIARGIRNAIQESRTRTDVGVERWR